MAGPLAIGAGLAAFVYAANSIGDNSTANSMRATLDVPGPFRGDVHFETNGFSGLPTDEVGGKSYFVGEYKGETAYIDPESGGVFRESDMTKPLFVLDDEGKTRLANLQNAVQDIQSNFRSALPTSEGSLESINYNASPLGSLLNKLI
ncbi:hypothetical protein A2625_04585 [candidate division WOR-1 bacterium RIFCSPHIGHO2_01_FULL_53_15]|uniref:Uncharacterized protein n=1 Tax=candidate division WOR-1 bacterium RIFCSPHIGHO2_01_FULL_53_15 TaxID=1802564 RepID=A0A1F4PZ81_UNCSA|nr:MAG: hypothetical protein A2625_04585 [candidate division WOR-1 bacterium RIFCSPHIGHO2_01_FULL_53_15]OGC10612.1 MAG: hypothetical protein A3D23_03805 [candidate division WOR-1 bacterium RIFCSPHIGHO2_02_FULL_53_26]